MTESTYFILASLMSERRHGYGIIKQAELLSDGRVSLAAGTLYGALERLLKQGLVETAGEEVIGGRARRYYVLTRDGEHALWVEAERMRRAVSVGPAAAPQSAAS